MLPILKLPCFFPRYAGQKTIAAISNLATFLTELSRSYIVLALAGRRADLQYTIDFTEHLFYFREACSVERYISNY